MEKKTLGETRLSQGPIVLWPTIEECMIMIQAALQVRRKIGSEHSKYLIQFHLVEDQIHQAGMEMGLLRT